MYPRPSTLVVPSEDGNMPLGILIVVSRDPFLWIYRRDARPYLPFDRKPNAVQADFVFTNYAGSDDATWVTLYDIIKGMKIPCSVTNCTRLTRTKRLCKMHYLRLWRYGPEYVTSPFRPTLEERFWANVSKGPKCWTWLAGKNAKGYGYISVDGKNQLAHRVSYTLENGPIPSSYELDHLCRQPDCVRASHLEPVTHLENVRRGQAGKINNHSSRKTHCPKGHPYDDANIYVFRRHRACRTCHRHQVKESLRRLKDTSNLRT